MLSKHLKKERILFINATSQQHQTTRASLSSFATTVFLIYFYFMTTSNVTSTYMIMVVHMWSTHIIVVIIIIIIKEREAKVRGWKKRVSNVVGQWRMLALYISWKEKEQCDGGSWHHKIGCGEFKYRIAYKELCTNYYSFNPQ